MFGLLSKMEWLDDASKYQICVHSDYPDLIQLSEVNKTFNEICQVLIPYKREVWEYLRTNDIEGLYQYLNTPGGDSIKEAVIDATIKRHFRAAFTLGKLKRHYLYYLSALGERMLNTFGLNPNLYLRDPEEAWPLVAEDLHELLRWGFILREDTYYIWPGEYEVITDYSFREFVMNIFLDTIKFELSRDIEKSPRRIRIRAFLFDEIEWLWREELEPYIIQDENDE